MSTEIKNNNSGDQDAIFSASVSLLGYFIFEDILYDKESDSLKTKNGTEFGKELSKVVLKLGESIKSELISVSKEITEDLGNNMGGNIENYVVTMKRVSDVIINMLSLRNKSNNNNNYDYREGPILFQMIKNLTRILETTLSRSNNKNKEISELTVKISEYENKIDELELNLKNKQDIHKFSKILDVQNEDEKNKVINSFLEKKMKELQSSYNLKLKLAYDRLKKCEQRDIDNEDEIFSLKNTIEANKEKLEEYKQVFNDMNSSILNLNGDNINLKSENNTLNQKINDLTSKILQLKKENYDLSEKNKISDIKLKILTETEETKDKVLLTDTVEKIYKKRIEQYEDEIIKKEKLLNKNESELKKIKDSKEEVQKSNKLLKDKVIKFSEKIDDLEEVNNDLVFANVESKSNIEELKDELEDEMEKNKTKDHILEDKFEDDIFKLSSSNTKGKCDLSKKTKCFSTSRNIMTNSVSYKGENDDNKSLDLDFFLPEKTSIEAINIEFIDWKDNNDAENNFLLDFSSNETLDDMKNIEKFTLIISPASKNEVDIFGDSIFINITKESFDPSISKKSLSFPLILVTVKTSNNKSYKSQIVFNFENWNKKYNTVNEKESIKSIGSNLNAYFFDIGDDMDDNKFDRSHSKDNILAGKNDKSDTFGHLKNNSSNKYKKRTFVDKRYKNTRKSTGENNNKYKKRIFVDKRIKNDKKSNLFDILYSENSDGKGKFVCGTIKKRKKKYKKKRSPKTNFNNTPPELIELKNHDEDEAAMQLKIEEAKKHKLYGHHHSYKKKKSKIDDSMPPELDELDFYDKDEAAMQLKIEEAKKHKLYGHHHSYKKKKSKIDDSMPPELDELDFYDKDEADMQSKLNDESYKRNLYDSPDKTSKKSKENIPDLKELSSNDSDEMFFQLSPKTKNDNVYQNMNLSRVENELNPNENEKDSSIDDDDNNSISESTNNEEENHLLFNISVPDIDKDLISQISFTLNAVIPSDNFNEKHINITGKCIQQKSGIELLNNALFELSDNPEFKGLKYGTEIDVMVHPYDNNTPSFTIKYDPDVGSFNAENDIYLLIHLYLCNNEDFRFVQSDIYDYKGEFEFSTLSGKTKSITELIQNNGELIVDDILNEDILDTNFPEDLQVTIESIYGDSDSENIGYLSD